MDFSRDDIELGLRYGPGTSPGVTSVLLFKEMLFPVCSPTFAERDRLKMLQLVASSIRRMILPALSRTGPEPNSDQAGSTSAGFEQTRRRCLDHRCDAQTPKAMRLQVNNRAILAD